MKKLVPALFVAGGILAANSFLAPMAEATGSWLKQNQELAPKVTLLSRSFRWIWDPFRVSGEQAYAVAHITNNHQYSLELKIYCNDGNRRNRNLRPLSGRHVIRPGQTFEWDTRRLVREADRKMDTIVICRFWVDGQVDLRGQIVNRLPARMGQQDVPHSLITFNYASFPPKKG